MRIRKFVLVLFTVFSAAVAVAGNQNQDPSQGGDPIVKSCGEWRCVSRCEYRTMEGECRNYGEDFCGYNARCVPYCEYRESSGNCRNYGKDVCGSGQDWD